MSSQTPLVAIVGRPNVGKSTLFNRLLGRRRAIVHDQPGVTRDRIAERAELAEGQALTLVDTGGLVPGDDPIGVNQQVLLAVEESDLLLLVVDGREGPLAADEIVWQELRRFGKPTILVVNKGDTTAARAGFHEFHRFGIAQTLLVSAEHGEGLSALREAMQGLLPAAEARAEDSRGASAVAIVGRPNVGKSSLVNRLVGEPRALVSPLPGTTRDPTDSLLSRGESSYLLIDTAGIRRRAQVSGAPEELAVLLARRQIERSEVAVLVVDASAGITSGDLAVAGAIWEIGRAAVVAVNKWDLLEGEARERLDLSWPRLAEVLADPRRVNLSAVSGRGVEKLFPALDGALAGYRTILTTGELNRLLEEALTAHRPPSERGRAWKLYYATQVSFGPPTFLLFANRSLALSDSYRRYLENRLRERLDLRGVPVRLVIRRREQRV